MDRPLNRNQSVYWDARCREPGYAYGIDANDSLVSVVDKIAVGDALCLCEGEGRNSTCLEFEIARQKSHVRASLMKASAEIAAGAADPEYQDFYFVCQRDINAFIYWPLFPADKSPPLPAHDLD